MSTFDILLTVLHLNSAVHLVTQGDNFKIERM